MSLPTCARTPTRASPTSSSTTARRTWTVSRPTFAPSRRSRRRWPMAELRADDVVEMTTPTWDRAKDAIRAGDTDAALALVDKAVGQWRSLQDYSINWITSTLSFIASELGEEAVERALRQTGEEFVRPRRDTGVEWGDLPARVRAKVIARAMIANFGECEVEEDDTKISLSFACGTGGRLIDEGKYDEEGGAYYTLR